jgi:hypothetical protein
MMTVLSTIITGFKILPPLNEEPPPAVGSLGVLREPKPFHVRFIEPYRQIILADYGYHV